MSKGGSQLVQDGVSANALGELFQMPTLLSLSVSEAACYLFISLQTHRTGNVDLHLEREAKGALNCSSISSLIVSEIFVSHFQLPKSHHLHFAKCIVYKLDLYMEHLYLYCFLIQRQKLRCMKYDRYNKLYI